MRPERGWEKALGFIGPENVKREEVYQAQQQGKE